MNSAVSVSVDDVDFLVNEFWKQKFDKADCESLAQKLGTEWSAELEKQFHSKFDSDEEEEDRELRKKEAKDIAQSLIDAKRQAEDKQTEPCAADKRTTEEDVDPEVLEKLSEMPAEANMLCQGPSSGYNHLSAHHRQLITSTAAYVIQAVPYAHLNKRIKVNVRRILSLGSAFTTNLLWAQQWTVLQDGVRSTMIRLSDYLDVLYKQLDLRHELGSYVPKLSDGASSTQFVPSECSVSQFYQTESVVRNHNLECIYIHFLRLLALAYDSVFQQAVKNALEKANIQLDGGKKGVSTGGIKGFERMYNKMRSAVDHGRLAKPRAQHNRDIVRCLMTAVTADDMRKAFDVIRNDVFGGTYSKFKNGHQWDRTTATSRFHLRIVLGVGRFEHPSCKTMGQLRAHSAVQAAWSSYLEQQPMASYIGRGTWKRQVKTALEWLNGVPAGTSMYMICEVQMLLKEYTATRGKMHELYKIVRADSPQQLHQDFTKYELQRQMQISKTTDGDTELKMACREGQDETVRHLLEQNPSEKAMVEALYVGARYAQAKCVKLILDQSKSLTQSQLGFACRRAAGDGMQMMRRFDLDGTRASIVGDLHAVGMEVNGSDDSGITVVYIAAQAGQAESLQLLIGAKADVDKAATETGSTPLFIAAQKGAAECLQLLIGAKADVDKARTDGGSTPSYIAAQKGAAECLQLLIGAKADVDKARTTDGTTPAYMAAQDGKAECLQLLIGAKADVNKATTDDGSTPSYGAAEDGAAECLQLLIGAKADVDQARTDTGTTPTLMAAEKGAAECLQLLIGAKADVDKARTDDGTTPSYTAAKNGAAECLQLLIGAKADVDKARTTDGTTPAYMAAQDGKAECLQLLIGAKADVDIKSKWDTPLKNVRTDYHGQASQKNIIVDLLLQAGATE